jgi:predicted trehalose synthase
MIPLRDVAGMLRSFAYLVATLDGQGTAVPEGFEDDARARFLAAYREAMQRTGLLPSAEGVQERLLDLFELEKVLYELRYELAHRPDWVGVPVAGIARFLDRVDR